MRRKPQSVSNAANVEKDTELDASKPKSDGQMGPNSIKHTLPAELVEKLARMAREQLELQTKESFGQAQVQRRRLPASAFGRIEGAQR